MRLNLFGFLMPKEAAFIDLFGEQSRLVITAAVELKGLIDGEGGLNDRFAAIHRIEGEADAVTKQIFLAAGHTFNAPIDRENILGLAHELDDIVDLIEETAKEIKRYEVRSFSEEMRVMADAVSRTAGLLHQAIPLLESVTREHQRIASLCEEVGRVEGEADTCFDEGLTRLRAQARAGEIDTLAYIDLKEIFEHLEDVVDKCDDVANLLLTITAKHV
jgi:uncharacterized protein